jgi:hypothetical protein
VNLRCSPAGILCGHAADEIFSYSPFRSGRRTRQPVPRGVSLRPQRPSASEHVLATHTSTATR